MTCPPLWHCNPHSTPRKLLPPSRVVSVRKSARSGYASLKLRKQYFRGRKGILFIPKFLPNGERKMPSLGFHPEKNAAGLPKQLGFANKNRKCKCLGDDRPSPLDREMRSRFSRRLEPPLPPLLRLLLRLPVRVRITSPVSSCGWGRGGFARDAAPDQEE